MNIWNNGPGCPVILNEFMYPPGKFNTAWGAEYFMMSMNPRVEAKDPAGYDQLISIMVNIRKITGQAIII